MGQQSQSIPSGYDSIAELTQRVASRPVPPRPHSAADFRKRRYRALSPRNHTLTTQLIDEEAPESEGSLRPYSMPCQPSQPSRTVPHPPTHPNDNRKATKRYLSIPRPMTARPDIQHGHTRPIT